MIEFYDIIILQCSGLLLSYLASRAYAHYIGVRILTSSKKFDEKATEIQPFDQDSEENNSISFKIFDYNDVILQKNEDLKYNNQIYKTWKYKHDTFKGNIFIFVGLISVAVLEIGFHILLDIRFPITPSAIYILLMPLFYVTFNVFRRKKLFNEVSRHENKKLLVLRTFGLMRNTKYLFKILLRYWKCLGTMFTIGDPSYARLELDNSSSAGLRPAASLCLLAVFLASGLSLYIRDYIFDQHILIPIHHPFLWDKPNDYVFIPFNQLYIRDNVVYSYFITYYLLTLTLAFVFTIVFLFFYSKRIVIATTEKLSAVLNRKTNYTLRKNSEYREVRLYCTENLWQDAFKAYVKECDAILMDIRGYTKLKAGITFEINYLINYVKSSKIVFLANQKSDIEFFKHVCNHFWKTLSETSVNKTTKPEIVIYQIGYNKVPQKREAPNIIKLLISAMRR